MVEERDDIRLATLDLWETCLEVIKKADGWMQSIVTQQVIFEWYSLAMTPLGQPVDQTLLYHPLVNSPNGGPERHNVDKNMLSQDLTLVSSEIVLRARVATAKAFAWLLVAWPENGEPFDALFKPYLGYFVNSTSMLQKFLAAIIVEEWCIKYDESLASNPGDGKPDKLIDHSKLAQELAHDILNWLQSEPPIAYFEMSLTLGRIHAECNALLQSFLHDCKISPSLIPPLGSKLDITGSEEGAFSIGTARDVVSNVFTKLKESLGRTKKKELIGLHEKRVKVEDSIHHYDLVKSQHDVRVSAAFAAAYVAVRTVPDKVSPIVKGIMNGVKVSFLPFIKAIWLLTRM